MTGKFWREKNPRFFLFPPLTKQQKCCHKLLVQQGFTGRRILPGQTLSLQKGRKRSKVYHSSPPSLPFPYLLLEDILPLQDYEKKKKKENSKPFGNPEVNLSFNKNLYSSSMLYCIRYSIMQFPSPIHKTPPQNQNLAALYKICLWLLFLEVLMKTRGLIDSISEEL